MWKSPEEQQKENWGERKGQAEQLGGGRGRKLEAARGKVKGKKKIKAKEMDAKAFMNAFPTRSTQPLKGSV